MVRADFIDCSKWVEQAICRDNATVFCLILHSVTHYQKNVNFKEARKSAQNAANRGNLGGNLE